MVDFELPGNEEIKDTNKSMSKGRKFLNCCKKVFSWNKEERPLTAQEAYFKTKYGDISSLDEYIEAAQNHIAFEIRRNMIPNVYTNINEDKFHSYYAMVDFDKGMEPYVDEIFKPFKDNGFQFIPLHDRIEEINNASVWLISWDKRRNLKR
jgi:hypothetical protein